MDMVHMLMTPEVKHILNEWADDWAESAKKLNKPELLENAGFLRGMSMIGMNTGSSVNRDALLGLRQDALNKVRLKDDPLMAKMTPKEVLADMSKEALVLIEWLDRHGVK